MQALPASQLTPDRFEAVDVGGRRVLLARLPDAVVAFASACPHLGQPLTRGTVEDGAIVCPHHFYAYDVRTGTNVFPGEDRDLALEVFAAEERDGWIWVTLPDGG